MALDRKHQKVFAKNAQSTDLGVVGSKMAGSEQYSTDIETLQSLSNWETGLRAQVSNSNAPYLQDQNSILYVITSQLAYLFQSGIAEWNSQTEYVANRSVVLKNGKIYIAIASSTNIEPEVTLGWGTYWKSLVDWGFIQGNLYKQTDLWNTILKGVYFDSTVASAIGGYPKGSRLLYIDKNNKYYVESLKDNNATQPTDENIYKVPQKYLAVTGVVNTTSNLPTASADTVSDLYLCLADGLVYITSANHQTTPTTYSWAGFSFVNIGTILDKSTQNFYTWNTSQWVNVISNYDWIAYNTQVEPEIMGITEYAIRTLADATVNSVHGKTSRPTLIVYGGQEDYTLSNWSFKLQVSSDNSTWVTLIDAKNLDGGFMNNIIIDRGLYWKFTTTTSSHYTLKSATLY